jgi:YD repeat-containing protein
MTYVRENGAASGAEVLAHFGYDDLGRRVSLTRGNGIATAWAWNGASRLTQIAHTQGAAAVATISMPNYNPAGQIKKRTLSPDTFAFTGHSEGSTAFTPNGLNQLTQMTTPPAAAVPLSRDAKGNQTSDGANTFVFDAEGRLVSANSAAVSLTYDPLGRLYRETDTNSDFQMQYDGLELVAEYNANGSLRRRYVPGPGLDEPLVSYHGAPSSAERRWLLADERGSIIAWTDGTGAVGAINKYAEYGVPAGANDGRFGYTGQIRIKAADAEAERRRGGPRAYDA